MMFYLIWGPPGVGKSSLGKALSEKLGFELIDLDRLIETKQNQSITSIFYTQGEGFFRELEFFTLQQIFDGKYLPSSMTDSSTEGTHDQSHELTVKIDIDENQHLHPLLSSRSYQKTKHIVLSLGGGTLCYPKSIELVKKHLAENKAMLFSLSADKNQLITQLQKDSTRPLLKDTTREGLSLKLDRLLEQRRSYYSLGIQVYCEQDFHVNLHRLYQSFCRSYPKVISADSYEILFKKNQQAALINTLKNQKQRYFVITDQCVYQRYVQQFEEECLAQGLVLHVYCIEEGEMHKNIQTVAALYEFCISNQIQRQDCLIAFGGGVVGDICGFVAATILRGIRWIQVPTTLLAQVDSSIGGKTGINHQAHKNMIGAFYPPSLVWIDLFYLQSLNDQQLKSGYVEAIKHGLIWDKALFYLFLSFLKKYPIGQCNWSQIDQDELLYLLQRSISIKNEIVKLDPKENGLRRLLNLGHTIGHAIEASALAQAKPLEHGYAVALGITAMLKAFEAYGLSPEEKEKILECFECLSLNLDWHQWIDSALPYLSMDKKMIGKDIFEVYLTGIGQSMIIQHPISQLYSLLSSS